MARTRITISKGILVASTNVEKLKQCRRYIVEVLYKPNFRIISETNLRVRFIYIEQSLINK